MMMKINKKYFSFLYETKKFKHIKSERLKLYNFFINYFSKFGYNYVKEIGLEIKSDPTLKFCNCTIVVAKQKWIKNEINDDYITIQNSLRTNTFEVIHSNNSLNWNSELTMIGGFLTDYKKIDDIIIQQINFIKKYLVFDYYEIYLTLDFDFCKKTNVDTEKIKAFVKKVVINNKKELVWKYGYKNFIGFGSRWEVLNVKNNFLFNFGNIIAIFDEENFIGYDFGGGAEILIQAKLNLKNKITVSPSFLNIIFKKVNLNDNFKIIDCIITIYKILFNSKVKENTIYDNYVLYMYYRALISLVKLWEIDFHQLYEYLKMQKIFFDDKSLKLFLKFYFYFQKLMNYNEENSNFSFIEKKLVKNNKENREKNN